ncbi:hypothetical protein EJ04DRAFT_602205 [Polyplosphaeria fusca]|uniref:Cleavage and polyadenylation specificity factor subunit 2 n=1 Tax=Polyplosphaeria fusca TaxID=682080 RepID=A0A9P4V306_9PLEO|nr:hypothetical protein EJ04DRAFT_602205 [Polyplosphaeria fusca]
MFNFTPLLGAQSTSPASQSLLEFDGGIKVLIDVGWDESFSVELLREIEKHTSTLSFVLLTHATTAHVGAYAHCCKHIPLFARIPVYATNPVVSLSRTLLQDLYASTPLAATIIPTDALAESAYSFPALKDGSNPNILLPAPTPLEIDKYFGSINALKYSQPHQPIPSPSSPALGGLTITAYSAGHTLGGTIWHIQYGMESVVYAVDWNQAREHVLSGAAWLGGPGTGGSEVLEQLRRPTAMICSSKGAGLVATSGQLSKRDEALLSQVRSAVGNGGSVLIPSDSSARILELAYLLEKSKQNDMSTNTNSALKDADIYLAGRTSNSTLRVVRSMLEWMEQGIVREFEAANSAQEAQEQHRGRGQQGSHGRGNEDEARKPFEFRHIKLIEGKLKFSKLLAETGPRIILASDTSLEWGFSKDALKALASDPRNLVILTERAGQLNRQEQGLGRYLWELWHEQSASAGHESGVQSVIDLAGAQPVVQTVQTEVLQGKELTLYEQYQAQQRQKQTTMQGEGGTALEASTDAVDEGAESSSDEEDEEESGQGRVLNTTTQLQHTRNKLGLSDKDLGVNILVRKKNVYDFYVVKTEKEKLGKRDKMYPFVAKRRRVDDFGDIIRPEDFARAEEEDHKAGDTFRDTAKKENAVGQKRKWVDLAVQPTRNGAPKRQKSPSGPTEADSESEAEADSEATAGPMRVDLGTEALSLHCKLTFIDFSGLHDRRTIQMLLPLIKPRKLIFVAGEAQETLDLADECRTLLNANNTETAIDVFTPTPGSLIDASVDTNAWTVKLSKQMAKKLHWQQVGGLSVVAITGRLAAARVSSPDPTAKKAKLDNDVATAAPAATAEAPDAPLPVLDVLPPNLLSATRAVAQPFHVGDLRLAELRKLMLQAGMSAEFRGEGTLVVDGSVAVRKAALGRIEVDGGAYGFGERGGGGGTFWRVRRMIYERLAVVAGG